MIDADDGHEDSTRFSTASTRRVAGQMLAEQTPARYVAFDLLARDDEALLERPFDERRRALELADRRLHRRHPPDPRAR